MLGFSAVANETSGSIIIVIIKRSLFHLHLNHMANRRFWRLVSSLFILAFNSDTIPKRIVESDRDNESVELVHKNGLNDSFSKQPEWADNAWVSWTILDKLLQQTNSWILKNKIKLKCILNVFFFQTNIQNISKNFSPRYINDCYNNVNTHYI